MQNTCLLNHNKYTMNQIKGGLYEKYIRDYMAPTYDAVYLWKDVPEKYLIDNGVVVDYDRLRDIGVDVAAVKDNKLTYIQCKNYTSNNVTIDDIAGFMWFIIMYAKDNQCILCYSNGISQNIIKTIGERKDSKIQLMHIPFENNMESIVDDQYMEFQPKPYQLEAVEKLKNSNKGILSLPCGMGKTFTASLLAKQYDNIIILAPLRQLVLDLTESFIKYMDKPYNKIIISTDGFANYLDICRKIGKMNIIGVCYDSVERLTDIIDILHNRIIIIDEFHNLSRNNLQDIDNPMNKLLQSDDRKLYLSATPIMDLPYDHIYRYSWKDAIKNKYICDFNITIPCSNILEKDMIDKMVKLLASIKDIDNEYIAKAYIAKAYFIVKGMMYNGNRKCIIYQTTIENARIFGKITEGVLKLLNIDNDIGYITCSCSGKERKYILDRFRSSDRLAILMNVQIMNEGIDIPECDSVFITQPNNNMINIVQRLCRCNRITLTKKQCNMYIWCGEKKIKRIMEYIGDNVGNIVKIVTKYSPQNNTKDVVRLVVGDDRQIIKEMNKNIPEQFIDDFFPNNGEMYYVNIEILAHWLDVRKDNLLKLLEANFEKDTDYIIFKNLEKKLGRGVNNRKNVMLTYTCSKLLSMISRSEKANMIRRFYLDLEKLLITYRENIVNDLNNQLKIRASNKNITDKNSNT